MNVSITPELEKFVQHLVASGRYHSASEVFRDGLRLLELAERRRVLEKWLTDGLTKKGKSQRISRPQAKLRSHIERKIQEGLDSLDKGNSVDGKQFLADWRERLEMLTTSTRKPRRVKRRA
jgi:putative addiction module CopG family antidote